jgi:hypothetical protein
MKKEKKESAAAGKTAPDEAAPDQTGSETAEATANELHEPFWSVISFEGRIASNLTYDDAVEKMRSLAEKETPGLCIVTNAAAQRMDEK